MDDFDIVSYLMGKSASGSSGKANEAQLAYVETGATASRNYTTGQYISWNGVLYTANQAITIGDTLSADTGGNLSVCVGGGFNAILPQEITDITLSSTYLDTTISAYVPKCSVVNGIAIISGALNVKSTVPAGTALAENFPRPKYDNAFIPAFRSDTGDMLCVRIIGGSGEFAGDMLSLVSLPKGSDVTVYYLAGCAYEVAE